MKKSDVSTVFLLLLLLFGTFCVGRWSKTSDGKVEIRVDTLLVTDTLRDTVPQYVNRYVVRTDIDTFVVNSTDTVYIPIPIERKEYRTNDYYAVVEGYKPKLTHIETFTRTQYINRYVEVPSKNKKRWGLGLSAGVGLTKDNISPFLGVSVNYNLLTW